MTILSLIVLALLGEAVWETSKMVWQAGKVNIDRIGAIVVAELLVFGAGIDLFALVGLPLHIPYVGIALTGLLISRGANFIHDLLVKIEGAKEIKDVSPTQTAAKDIEPKAEYKEPQETKPVDNAAAVQNKIIVSPQPEQVTTETKTEETQTQSEQSQQITK